jgi:ribosomal protein L11 methyltransferase
MREGLIPHKVVSVLRLSTTEGAARALTEALGELLDAEETAVAAFEQADRSWLVEVYFAREPDEAAVRHLVALGAGEAVARQARFVPLAAKDWVAASLEGLRPVRAGRFLVHGAHDRALLAVNDIGVEIEAALAFGTGHHGTTFGCLLALDALLKRGRPARVLDVGTGTGVLAIAAAKALRREVVAGDIDPVAVEVARANARANGVGPLVRVYRAPGLRHPLAAAGGFDLVLANILARPLARLAPSLAAALAPGGRLVLSGLLAADVPGILAAFGARRLHLERRAVIEGWATLVLGGPA